MMSNAGGPGAPAALLQHVFSVVRKWYISIDYHHVGFIGSALGEPAWHCASAFVLQIEERCLLFTAGHVIQDLKRALSQGAVVDRWQINDGAAGASHSPIPYDPELELWIAIDDRELGIDLAFSVLPAFVARGLLAAGVMPPGSSWWLDASPYECAPWFVFGTPSETLHEAAPGRVVALPTMFTADPLSEGPPSGTIAPDTRLGPHLLYAKLPPRRPIPGTRPIKDLDGVSGGPVVGLRRTESTATLHIIGIQSGVLESAEILTVCPLRGFLEVIETYLRE
jgi:hypothetical protein